MSDELKGLHVRIPTDLHRRLKLASVKLDRPMGELVAEAIQELLDRVEG